jgi:hypothetical protein
MKIIRITILLALFLICILLSGCIFLFRNLDTGWDYVGKKYFTQASYLGDIDFKLDNNGVPYVAYADDDDDEWHTPNKATVMKFTGKKWVHVGSPRFSNDDICDISMAIGSNNHPIVACAEGFNIAVKKYNGTSWVNTGSLDLFSSSYISLCLDSSDTPYLAFTDGDAGYKLTILKYNGAAWEGVGDTGITGADEITICIDLNDKLYIVFTDENDMLSVMSFDGSSWEYIGLQGFAHGHEIVMAVDGNGTPYTAYQTDIASGFKAMVMMFDNPDWLDVGQDISDGAADSLSLAFDSNDIPYIAFCDDVHYDEITVKKYEDSSWILIGTAGFSQGGSAGRSKLAISSDNTLYAAYLAQGHDDKISVMKH